MKPVRTLIAATVAALSINAQAATLPTDGSWIQFDFGGPEAVTYNLGTAIYDLTTLETSFTFTLDQAAVLRVVDTGFSGDRFEIFANGHSLGQTSLPADAGEELVFDADSAWADGRWSKGSFSLTAGVYAITGLATLSPFDGGYGLMSIAAVPEPGEWAMLLAGLGMVGSIARRRMSRRA